MIPYWILLVIPAVAWLINNRLCLTVGKDVLYKTESLSIDIFMFMFLILLAFRGLECGNDTIQYLRLYNEYNESSFSGLVVNYRHELGYKLLSKCVGLVFNNYQYLLIITSIVCVIPLWYLYKRESENSLLTILLFLSVAPFVMYFSGIRQAIAMSFGVLSWYAAKNKKLWLFILLVFLAIQFHTSAFMLILIYPLYYAKITKKWLWFVIPFIFGVYIFRTPIFNFLITFLWEDFGESTETNATTVLILLIIFAIYSFVMVSESDLDKDTIALRNILLLATVIQIFALLHPLSMRMNYYFLIFVPILIPKIVKRCKKEYMLIADISVIVMIVYFIYHFCHTVITDSDPLNIFPYIPFWENPPL